MAAPVSAHSTRGGDPLTLKEALRRSDAREWLEAAKEEYDSHQRNGTWELVELPVGRKTVKCKWVFAIKRDASGNIIRFKARLVAKGFTQVPGIDFDETFAPVARLDSWRYLVALAAHLDWEIHQIDFDQAFLNGSLDEEIYMEQPEGFVVAAGKVCRLRKAL